MNIDPFASVAAARCQSKGCHRRGTALAVDIDHPGDGIPEVYCRDCLRVLVGQIALRPATGAKATLWRVADELKAHHHAVASLLITGLGLISGVQGVGAWVLLVAFTGSVVADVVALRQRTRQLWPLCLPPTLIGMVVAAALLEPVSYLGIVTAAAYLYMLLLDLCRGRVEASSVEAHRGPPKVPAGMVSIGDLLNLDDGTHGWVTVTDLVRDDTSAGHGEIQLEWRDDSGEVGDLIIGRGELLEIRRLDT